MAFIEMWISSLLLLRGKSVSAMVLSGFVSLCESLKTYAACQIGCHEPRYIKHLVIPLNLLLLSAELLKQTTHEATLSLIMKLCAVLDICLQVEMGGLYTSKQLVECSM